MAISNFCVHDQGSFSPNLFWSIDQASKIYLQILIGIRSVPLMLMEFVVCKECRTSLMGSCVVCVCSNASELDMMMEGKPLFRIFLFFFPLL